jgi:hypothetical protein
VDTVADSIAINNKLSFEANDLGVCLVMNAEREARNCFYKKLAYKMPDVLGDFFSSIE